MVSKLGLKCAEILLDRSASLEERMTFSPSVPRQMADLSSIDPTTVLVYQTYFQQIFYDNL